MLLRRSILLSLLAAATALAAGPVYVRTSGSTIVIGNDYLERTISIADGDVGTRQLLNKITGHAYSLRGDEFEIKVNEEWVGYNAGKENPHVITASGVRVASQKVSDTQGGGKRVELHLAPAPPGRASIDLIYELNPDEFYTRQLVHIAKPAQGTWFLDAVTVARNEWGGAHFSLGGFGQPLFADDLFLGLEFPTGSNVAAGNLVTLGYAGGINIPDGGYTSEPAVMGVAPAGLVHRQFLDYVARIRVAPVRPYLLYNTWYDYPRLKMNGGNTTARVGDFQKLLLAKYGLHLDSFVLDDGWDDMHKLWVIDQQRFPNGFRDLTAALKTIDSQLGIWFGPIGGYDQSAVRIATGKGEGMEVTSNDRYFCVAGKNYSKLLTDTMLRYQKEYGINYFKLDGIAFGCNDPQHGHPVGVYSDEATARTFIGMLEKLRAQDPKVFLNITTSIWLSPWWLRYGDTVWMGGADSGYLPTVPTMAERQSAVSYRDSVLYDDFVTHHTQFPISSLMTHGIIKGQANMLGGNKEQIEDWRDEVVHYYSVGNMMYELYISPDILTGEEMETLGNTTKWAMANAHPLLDNSTMVLGDPAQRDPYGYVHSNAAKSIVTLRNPFVRPRTVKLKLDELNGFTKVEGPQLVEVIYPYREILTGSVRFGESVTFDLGAYEQVVFEVRPSDSTVMPIRGTRFSVQGSKVLTYDATKAAEMPDIAVAPLRAEGAAGAVRTIHAAVTVQVPASYRQARVAFLLEPDQVIQKVTGEATDAGAALPLTAENGNRGNWHWFYANLPPGKHTVDLTFHVPAANGNVRVSGWLLTRRVLPSQEAMLDMNPPANLLPAESEIERGTHLLVEETVR
jgi:Melibiase